MTIHRKQTAIDGLTRIFRIGSVSEINAGSVGDDLTRARAHAFIFARAQGER
jgi:hypothetical protein